MTTNTPVIPTDGGNEHPYDIYPNLSQNSYTWNTNVPAGTSVAFALEENFGALAFTAPEIVK
ncbi:hypothetical protein CONPUDRAFT_150783 [Coniophora puteana RWD-64-598 SS2]|uniref:Uncharacterized protein n=1 Tax=Coniophora puteana (strain RWD-64-598) TaxID=741705 RepID=A0A5M3MXJ4_CONPW|nr:uncharacterized protein CONPUDRAFT_150783 [Coniophora puteana RWD-64-598 SS2]EIW83717.1 hypothetical protein CONPUDRAFT_150783 [Coniophora puteana RWD-64-598 SS2]